MTQGPYRALISYLIIFLLATFVAGCGGDDAETPPADSGAGGKTPPPQVPNVLVENMTIDPGDIIEVAVGDVAILDGSGITTTETEALSLLWSFIHIPDGSKTVLQNVTTVTPSFTADVRGTYMVQVVVTVGEVSADPVIASVEATNSYSPAMPIPKANHITLKFNSRCITCHIGGVGEIIGKSPDHIATGNECQACHSIFGFTIIPYVDHSKVFGVCSSCHDGELAIGKSDEHVTTTVECDECHSTVSFLFIDENGDYDHSDIGNNCVRCHNVVLAIGKDDDHLTTAADCAICHTTDTFKPATFTSEHGLFLNDCARSGCHTGATGEAVGIPDGHPDTNSINVDCNVCHSTTTFSLGDTFNHATIISRELACQSCHDGANAIALPKTADHIVTSSDCGNCHITSAFIPSFVDHSSEAVTGPPGNPLRCDSCHNNDPTNTTGAIGLPLPPLPHIDIIAPEDCGDRCHTPGTFTSGVYDHIEGGLLIDANCASCHNDINTAGVSVNHIPISVDCSVCHTTDTFTGVTFDHANIGAYKCEECHDGVISIGKDKNHLPTNATQDCVLCHGTAYTNFADGAAFHANVTVSDNCMSCHDRVIATGKPRRTHIPTLDDCSVCHVVSTSFVGGTFDHQGTTRGCEGCHNGQFTTAAGTINGKTTDHLPTNQDCNNCHLSSAWADKNFTHAGITRNCESCHDGNYVATGALAKTANHLETVADCGNCHNTSGDPKITPLVPSFKYAFVDHTSVAVTGAGITCVSCHDGVAAIGKSAKVNPPHVVTDQDCGICHVAGATFAPAVFDHSNLPRGTRCDSCHNGTNAIGIAASPVTHVAIPLDSRTNQPSDCKLCHNTTAFAGAKYNHRGIVDNCASCHGDTATGKSTNHVPTTDDCSVCHQTTGFVPATFDHTGIVDNCVSCHDGVFAIGKTPDHIATNEDCGVCHSFDTFVGGRYDHTGIVDNCARSGCHGSGAKPKNAGHVPTTLDCSNCHTTTTFVGGTWDHGNNSAGKCLDCHGLNGVATTQPTRGHFDTQGAKQCDVCHVTTGWAPANKYDHCPNTTKDTCTSSDYPGTHNRRVTCIDCHTKNDLVVFYPATTYAPFCAGCHKKDFRAEGDHIGGRNGTVEQNKNCGRSGCHRVSAGGF